MSNPLIWITGLGLLMAAEVSADDSPMQRERRGSPEREPLSVSTVSAPSPRAVTAPDSFGLTVDGDANLSGYVFQGGVPFIHNDGTGTYRNTAIGLNAMVSLASGPSPYNHTYGADNTAMGYEALTNATSGFRNTAAGVRALYTSTEGDDNTAIGFWALVSNTLGSDNTAVGAQSAYGNTEGNDNTAVGFQSLRSNSTGSGNTAVGHVAMRTNQTGNFNTGLGYAALRNSTGSFNTAVGSGAGQDLTGSKHTAIGWNAGQHWTYGSYNIGLGAGSDGIAGEYATIRIGGNNFQAKTFIEGVNDAEVVGSPVCVTGNDELGLCPAPINVQGMVLSPALLAEVRRLEAELAVLRRRLEELERR